MNKIQDLFMFFLILTALFILKPTYEIEQTKFKYMLDTKVDITYADVKKDTVVSEYIEESCSPRNLNMLGNKKLIAFTFDDGPNNPTTLNLIDNLSKYNARVTFFVLGSRVNTHKESLIKAYEKCNQIGSHTYNHLNLLKQDDSTILNEINSTNKAIYDLIGVNPTIIRPPYGNTNLNIKTMGNMPTILWSIDTLDWKYRDSNKIANEIIENAYDGSIILLHDIYPTSVEGALIAMDKLKDEYAFVTIEEMMMLKGINTDISKSYIDFK